MYAPDACSLTSCAPHAIGVDDSAACACIRYGYGTQTASFRPGIRDSSPP